MQPTERPAVSGDETLDSPALLAAATPVFSCDPFCPTPAGKSRRTGRSALIVREVKAAPQGWPLGPWFLDGAESCRTRLKNRVYPLLPPARLGERGGKVIVEQRPDGSTTICFETRHVEYKKI